MIATRYAKIVMVFGLALFGLQVSIDNMSDYPSNFAFVQHVLPELRTLSVPLWVSVGGFSASDYAETCAQLDDVTIELNLSCPNVEQSPERTAEIVSA